MPDGIAFNPSQVLAVNLSGNQCKITFPKYAVNIGSDFVGTNNYYQGSKEFAECMRVYNVLKKE